MTETSSFPKRDWRPLVFGVIIAALFIVAALMRLHQLGLKIDRDGYDEGIFWQTLLAIFSGKQLYQDIFCSQPPAFLMSIYPLFVAWGKTILAARLGIAVMSMIGLAGAAILGHALSGRKGAVIATLLLVASPAYLMQSQTLQGEAPSIALSLLSVGCAFQWWKTTDKKAGYYFGIISAIALSLSIFVKLVSICAFIPIAMLVLMKLRSAVQEERSIQLNRAYSVIAATGVFFLVSLVFFVMFMRPLDSFLYSGVRMYTTAQEVFQNLKSDNILRLQEVLFTPLGIAALFAIFFAIKLRDNGIYPLIGWMFATLWMLWSKVPLFSHHTLSLLPSLIAILTLGITCIYNESSVARVSLNKIIPCVMICIILLVNGVEISRYYSGQKEQANAQSQVNSSIVKDLQNVISSNQLVITDAPFKAALAQRRTPAALVDTSVVRVTTGFVTSEQLIQEANNSQVGAILFYSGRLSMKQLKDFQEYVPQHFKLFNTYADGQTLWIKKGVDGRE